METLSHTRNNSETSPLVKALASHLSRYYPNELEEDKKDIRDTNAANKGKETSSKNDR